MEYIGIIEGLLYVMGDEGITYNKLLEILEIEESKLTEVLDILKKTYENETRGFRLEILGNKYKLTTKKEHSKYFEKLIENNRKDELSQSALETLAIIAYKSPITRSQVDEIRGLDSAYQIKKLMYRNLIKEAGKSDLPGRPILYTVTDQFLDYLGLSSINELPEVKEEIEKRDTETDLYESKYKEN
jgi:segregation and condensation protein B